jgi:hypothetical protein
MSISIPRNIDYSTIAKEGSYPTVNSTTSSAYAMDLMINCDLTVDTFYVDINGQFTLDPTLVASPSGGTPPYTLEVLPSDIFACDQVETNIDLKIRVTDDVGDQDSCEYVVMLLDTFPPIITCPIGDTILVATMDSCGAYIAVDTADATSTCVLMEFTITNNYNLASNNISGVFPVGSTLITYYAEDEFGNVDSCSFTIQVQDFSPPFITCPPTPSTPYSCNTIVPNIYTNIDDFVANGGMVSDSCGIDSTSWAYNEIIDDTQCPIEITRWYIVSDINGMVDSCMHVLYLNDEFAVLDLLPIGDITESNDLGECSAELMLTPPDANKFCGVTITRTPLTNTFPVGQTIIEWIATDGCGDMDTVYQTITIEDNEQPNVTCEGAFDIGLTSNPPDSINAEDFIKGYATDNCSLASVGVFRQDGGCVPGDDIPDLAVYFCCSDVGTDVVVWVVATDTSGNERECTVTVTVNDNLGPVLEQGLPDITVSCDFFIDLKDLSPFGTIAFDADDQEPIEIDDPLFVGPEEDGLAIDNCNDIFILSDTPVDNRVNNAGQIIRTIVISDSQGRTVTDEQIITIQDTDPLTAKDIQFPNDITIVFNSCSDSIPAHMTGEPIIDFDDICTMPAAFFEDLVFDDPNSGCIFVKRTWTVIDMAQYLPNENPPKGIWTDVQYITVNNTEAPIIDSIIGDLDYKAIRGACDVLVEMNLTANDSCTAAEDLYFRYIIDLNRDGIEDIDAEANSFSIVLPTGDHSVTWKVEDRCGNLSKYTVEFTAREAKSPTPICHHGLTADLSNVGSAEVWASDFDAGSSDNCTPEDDLIFSFSDNILDTNKTFTCDDKGVNQISVFVTDEEGNQSLCITDILITDNIDPCPIITLQTNRVGGKIATEENITIPETKVSISDLLETEIQMSDEKGKFMFEQVPSDKDYIVAAAKNDNCMEGVSTLDLVLIQRHILGQEKLTSPYKLLAADVNNSDKITASDLVELRKVILGIKEDFSNTDCWLFIDNAYVFDDPKNPWNYPTSQSIEQLDFDMLSSDFVAVKIGDVNGSVSNIHNTSSENRSPKVMDLVANDLVFDEGDEIVVPMTVSKAEDLLAIQMNFSFNNTALEFIDIKSDYLNITPSLYHLKQGQHLNHISLAYAEAEAITLLEGDQIIELVFTAKTSDRLSNVMTENSSILQAVMYDSKYDQNYINFRFDEDQLNMLNVDVPSPNPFFGRTSVDLTLAQDMPLEISVYNQSGIKVYNNYANYSAGMNKIVINDQVLNNESGVFYLHIAGAEMKEIVKLIRIQ